MTRQAKLFYLNHREIDALKEAINFHDNQSLKYQISIYKVNVEYHRYVILSISEKVDMIINDYGCIEAEKGDLWIRDFKETDCTLIFGDETISNFLEYK